MHDEVKLTPLEVQQEPAVAEVEVSVVSVLLHELEQLRVQDLRSGENVNGHTHTHTHIDTHTHTHTHTHRQTHTHTRHLDQGPHVGEVSVHGSSVGEVLSHPLHQLSEAAEGQAL